MIVLCIILMIIILISAVLFWFDVKFDFINWVSRIGIGNWSNSPSWRTACEDIIYKWLIKKTPSVPKKTDERFVLIKKIKSKNSASSIALWQEASIINALNSEKESEENSTAFFYAADKYIDIQSGDWIETAARTAEKAAFAFSVLNSPYVDIEQVRPAMRSTAQEISEISKRCGTVPYTQDDSNIRFVDTIGMICPFLIKYSLVYNYPDMLEIAMKQIEEFYSMGIHNKLLLPVHCFDKTNAAELGIYGWGRGCGWWAMGLIDSLIALLSDFDKPLMDEKKELLKMSISFADVMLEYQNKNGSYSRMLLCKSESESSATAMMACFYAELGKLSGREKYTNAAKNALAYLKTCTRKTGEIDLSQGDTIGIANYSTKFILLPATQGYAVRAMNVLDY